MCFTEKSLFVLDGSTKVSDTKLSYLSIARQGGSLKSRGVESLFCPEHAFVEISGFVVKQVDAPDDVLQLGQIKGIGAIGIGAWQRGRGSKAFVRNDGAVLCCP